MTFMRRVRKPDGLDELHFEGDHLHGHVVACHNSEVAADADV